MMTPVPPHPLLERLAPPGAKRILTIDGAGPRVLVALGQLGEIETRLARRAGSTAFRLCDYYDLICGVSTGAAAAALLACGASVAETAQRLFDLVRVMAAEDAAARAQGLKDRPAYDPAAATRVAEQLFGDATLGEAPRTGLAIVLRRFDIGPWIVSNDPRQWAEEKPDTPLPQETSLARLAHAAVAAPTFFEGRMVEIWPGHEPVAVADARSLGLANPAVLTLRHATDVVSGLGWQTGADRLLMTSVGAGVWRAAFTEAEVRSFSFARAAPSAALGLLSLRQGLMDQGRMTDGLMRALAGPLEAPAEAAGPALAPLSPVPLLHYARFDVELDLPTLTELGAPCSADELARLRSDALSEDSLLSVLFTIGERAAAAQLAATDPNDPRHRERAFFPRSFEPAGFGRRIRVGPELRLEALGRVFHRQEDEA